jgi:hypothetical protein
MVEMVHGRIAAGGPQWFQLLLYCNMESKWKNYHFSTFPGQSFPKIEVMCEMRRLEIKHSGGKLLPHSDLTGTVNRHNCGYWAPVNPRVHVGKKVTLPGVNVWCGVSPCGLIGTSLCDGIVTGLFSH